MRKCHVKTPDKMYPHRPMKDDVLAPGLENGSVATSATARLAQYDPGEDQGLGNHRSLDLSHG
jgi:hypothetical protein